MASRNELLREAQECDAVADEIYERTQGDEKLKREIMEPFYTDEGERQPNPAAVALGALRERAAKLRRQVEEMG